MSACPECRHDSDLLDKMLGEALKNEQQWVDLAVAASKMLERAGLALPEGALRDECLSMHAQIQTTPFDAKRGARTRNYHELHP